MNYIKNKLGWLLAAVFSMLVVTGQVSAAIIEADPSTGDLTVDVTSTAVKMIGLVVAIVTGFLMLKFIGPLWAWIGRMIRGK